MRIDVITLVSVTGNNLSRSFPDLVFHADLPPISPYLTSRPITSGCGSKERPKPLPSVGWSWRNPSKSSWTSLATSRCSSSESCSMCPMCPGWIRRPPGKESPHTVFKTKSSTRNAPSALSDSCAVIIQLGACGA